MSKLQSIDHFEWPGTQLFLLNSFSTKRYRREGSRFSSQDHRIKFSNRPRCIKVCSSSSRGLSPPKSPLILCKELRLSLVMCCLPHGTIQKYGSRTSDSCACLLSSDIIHYSACWHSSHIHIVWHSSLPHNSIPSCLAIFLSSSCASSASFASCMAISLLLTSGWKS